MTREVTWVWIGYILDTLAPVVRRLRKAKVANQYPVKKLVATFDLWYLALDFWRQRGNKYPWLNLFGYFLQEYYNRPFADADTEERGAHRAQEEALSIIGKAAMELRDFGFSESAIAATLGTFISPRKHMWLPRPDDAYLESLRIWNPEAKSPHMSLHILPIALNVKLMRVLAMEGAKTEVLALAWLLGAI